MLLVKTDLRQSATHGLGVFAAELIPAGTRVWEYREGFERRLLPEFVESLPEVARLTVLHYCAFWKGAYITSADNSRFLNHSFHPNLRSYDEPDCDIALRDIQIGEELTEDYREFDGRFLERGIADTGTAADRIDPAVERMLNVARGCHDYNGGHGGGGTRSVSSRSFDCRDGA